MRRASISCILALPICDRVLHAKRLRILLYDKLRHGYPALPGTIGEHLRRRRIDRGLTLDDAASLLGTSRSLLHGWEKGRRRPTTARRKAVVAFLGYSPYVVAKDRAGRVSPALVRTKESNRMPRLIVENVGTFDAERKASRLGTA